MNNHCTRKNWILPAIFTVVLLCGTRIADVLVPDATAQSATMQQAEINAIREEARAVAELAVRAQRDAQAKILEAAQAEASIKIPFNRNLRLRSEFNKPPIDDGIHDPTNEDIKLLHSAGEVMAAFPPANMGNRVDWVAAIAEKKIEPAWDLADPEAERMIMDLDIQRVPRGSMPNVIFPHKQHTEWLACANCHPAVFVPQKGANQINMRLILGGERCGVCHGKVSFPPATACLKCHSQDKALPTNAAVKP